MYVFFNKTCENYQKNRMKFGEKLIWGMGYFGEQSQKKNLIENQYIMKNI